MTQHLSFNTTPPSLPGKKSRLPAISQSKADPSEPSKAARLPKLETQTKLTSQPAEREQFRYHAHTNNDASLLSAKGKRAVSMYHSLATTEVAEVLVGYLDLKV